MHGGIFNPAPLDWEERQARMKRLREAYLQAFGDDDYTRPYWGYVYSSEFGTWQSPEHFAAESDENLERALARLAELAIGVTPSWKPKIKGQKRVSRKRWR